MINSNVASDYGDFKLGQISWKHYNTIKKKAMEQEFSLSGLVVSLSIAFFIVIIASFFLSSLNKVLQKESIIYNSISENSLYIEEAINTENSIIWDSKAILQFRA